MEAIYIKGTDVSPEVIFNPGDKKYSISGWSRPESPSRFYAPVIKWIEEYGATQLHQATINFSIEYFNTPSARVLREILAQLNALYEKGTRITVNWYFDDESSKEELEYEFAQGLTLPINFLLQS
jgi:hypothetical protein